MELPHRVIRRRNRPNAMRGPRPNAMRDHRPNVMQELREELGFPVGRHRPNAMRDHRPDAIRDHRQNAMPVHWPNAMLALGERLGIPIERSANNEPRFGNYRFRLDHTTAQTVFENLNDVSLKVTIRINYPNRPPRTGAITMTPKSRREIHFFTDRCTLTVTDAVEVVPFIIGKRADAPVSSEMCTFSVGEDAIFVDHLLLQSLSLMDFKPSLLLDESRSFEIENVEFPILVTFFKLIFEFLPFSDFGTAEIETCRKLMDLFQRFYTFSPFNKLFCQVEQFLTDDFYSATNLFCIFCTKGRRSSRFLRSSVIAKGAKNLPNSVLWGDTFKVDFNVLSQKKRYMQSFQHFDLNWKFHICIETINKVEYLGVGVIIESTDKRNKNDFGQTAEIEVKIRNDDSSFSKQLTLSRKFYQYQSSAGCPVIARMDEINLDQNDHLIFDVQVKNKFTEVSEFCGEKDTTLVIEGKKIVTSKNLLIHHFDYFKTLFESNFDDKNQKELVLHGVNYEDMYNIFDVIYNRSKSLTVNELEGMLILADRFLCPYIIQYIDIAIAEMSATGAPYVVFTTVVSLDEMKYFAENYHQLVRVKESVKRELIHLHKYGS